MNRVRFTLTLIYGPDWANPCKHIAGVYYRLAEQLDQDPLLLFELRGLARANLRTELAQTPLGQALAPLMSEDDQTPLEPAESLYPPLQLAREESTRAGVATSECRQVADHQGFWRGRVPLPTEPLATMAHGARLSGIGISPLLSEARCHPGSIVIRSRSLRWRMIVTMIG